MLPKKELNIYPKSEENIKALISYYFDAFDLDLSDSLDFLKQKNSISLNQIEFVVRKLSEAYLTIFQTNLKGVIQLKNLLNYGFDALTINETDWVGNKPRLAIIKSFRDFVRKTEIDYDYLEKNN